MTHIHRLTWQRCEGISCPCHTLPERLLCEPLPIHIYFLVYWSGFDSNVGAVNSPKTFGNRATEWNASLLLIAVKLSIGKLMNCGARHTKALVRASSAKRVDEFDRPQLQPIIHWKLPDVELPAPVYLLVIHVTELLDALGRRTQFLYCRFRQLFHLLAFHFRQVTQSYLHVTYFFFVSATNNGL